MAIPNAGHEYGKVWVDCLDDIVAQFLSQGTTFGLDAACVEKNQRPPFVSWRDYIEPGSDAPPKRSRIKIEDIRSKDLFKKKLGSI